MTSPLLVVTGLRSEAGIASADGVRVEIGGGRANRLAARLEALPPGAVAGVLSFGIAGGLSSTLSVGDVVVASEVADGPDIRRCSLAWGDRLARRLDRDGIALHRIRLVGQDGPALTAGDKDRLARVSGAGAIDMESHASARFAASRDLPFAVVRVVSDGATDTLPPAAAVGMRPDGSVDVIAVLRSLAGQPGQLPALLRTARDAGRAFRKLRRVGALLRPGFGFDL